MENGINGDQNFYSRRQLPQSQDQGQQRSYPPPPLSDFDAQPPQLPPTLPFLTAQNLQAASANGFGNGAVIGGGEPDQFYREYRGVQQSTNGYTEVTNNGMPATSSETRQMPSSLRSNGSGTTPKHPSLPAARNNLKPTCRSISSPLDERTTLANAKSTSALNGLSTSRQQPSVKDLLRRFDQNNEQPSSVARKPSPRIQTQDINGTNFVRDRVGYQARSISNNQSTSRAGTSSRGAVPNRVKSPQSSKPTQRTRFATEDQHSINTLSSTARAPKPRNVSAQASKSMTNLSPTISNPPTQVPPRRPLFGEVLTNEEGQPGVAYGIPRTTGRRTSDSSLHPPWFYNRDLLNGEIDPSSPTSWYLGITPRLDDVNPNVPRSSRHNRNHSDFADNKVNNINHIMPTFNTTAPTPTTPHQLTPQESAPQSSHTSRLPVSTHRYSGSSESSAPSTRGNSRANSPLGIRGANGRYRKHEQRPWSPAALSGAGNHSHIPSCGSRGRARTPDNISMNNSRLNAFISAPPPKLSPPLRSSRPRQPVSTASTASSRQKMNDRSGSPNRIRTGMKVTRIGGDHEKAATKMSVNSRTTGPIDFAAHRANIQRAYTRSIHESQQKQIRAENMRRLQERTAKNSATSTGTAQEDASRASTKTPSESPPRAVASPEPLHIDTAVASPNRNHDTPRHLEGQDSPTLGIPGTFVDDEEAPASAISNVTSTTEIENEPQTEAPRLSRMQSDPRSLRLSSQVHFMEDRFSPEQAIFGFAKDDEKQSINIMLDATPVEEPQTQSTPTNDFFSQERDPSPPGAFEEDYPEQEQPKFSSNITAAGSRDETLAYSRSPTPLEASDERLAHDECFTTPSETDCDSQAVSEVAHQHQMSYDTYNDHSPTSSEPPYTDVPRPVDEENYSEQSIPVGTLAPPILVTDAVQDHLNTTVTDVDYESSDGAGGANAWRISKTNSSIGDLRAPSQNYRSSHQSAWTDLSVESNDSRNYDQLQPSPKAVPVHDEFERKPTPPPKEDLAVSPIVPPKPEGYSPQPSPMFPSSRLASPAHNELPPIKVGDGIGLDFNDRSSNFVSVTPLWPEHAPPPPPLQYSEAAPVRLARSPPPPSLHSRRPNSDYQASHEDTSQPIDSRRGSDDLVSPRPSSSTPRSSAQISSEDVTLSRASESRDPETMTEEEKAADKAKKSRLFKRRMLITELIDTESVYLKDLNVIVEIYQGTAEACPKLDATDITTLFRNTAEIVAFTTKFLDELKAAASSVYQPRKTRSARAAMAISSANVAQSTGERFSPATTLTDESDEQKDKKTFIGATFGKHLKKMQEIYTDFLKSQEQASTRLAALQMDSAVKVWLSECNLVAKDLTAAWDLDALLVKPVQRITRYQLVLNEISRETLEDHPDYSAMTNAVQEISIVLRNIDDTKKRLQMVTKIVGRKRKDSDVRSGLAKAFGRRTEKLQSSANRPPEDEVYVKLHEKFGDDYLRLQVVLRDVEFYTRQCSTYVTDFLRYLSAMELIMRMSASPYPELESKWARFNMSMRDMGTIALEDHVSAVRHKVIEPFERVIQAYGPPGLVMKKRTKRRLDYEKFLVTKPSARDAKLHELKDQYEALNDTLKLELPKLSAKTETIGNICLIQLVNIQTLWYQTWQEKVKVVLEESQMPKEIGDIVDMFSRDYKYVEARAHELGIVNGTFDSTSIKARGSHSTQEDDTPRSKGRPSNLSTRSRGMSQASDRSPSLPTPEFVKTHNGQFTCSPIAANAPGLPPISQQYRPFSASQSIASSSPATPDPASASRQYSSGVTRPGTSRSYTSDNGVARLSNDNNPQYRRESYNSSSNHQDGPPSATRPFSGLFNSALPDGLDDSQRSSRTSSRDPNVGKGFNVLYLAASLFEFNIGATKSEAGYPYLTYSAGEIFDVIGEKGELWLAKNQDDPQDVVGWIWSKHFARLASD